MQELFISSLGPMLWGRCFTLQLWNQACLAVCKLPNAQHMVSYAGRSQNPHLGVGIGALGQ